MASCLGHGACGSLIPLRAEQMQYGTVSLVMEKTVDMSNVVEPVFKYPGNTWMGVV